ncbi:hypothetical protein D6C89_04839 [Aureobasidium pullulans]|nr:hypothetical protein D6C89_04839 [Aureobasidium pullulans]
MAYHDPTGRDRSARRGESGRDDPPRPYVSSNIEDFYNVRIDDVRIERSSDPPPLPEIHILAPDEPIHIITPPPPAFAASRSRNSRSHNVEKAEYAFVRRHQRASRDHPDRAHDLKMNDEFIEEYTPKDDEYRMPSIQQNYRPRLPRPPLKPYSYETYNLAAEIPPEPIVLTESVPHRKKNSRHRYGHDSHVPSGDSSEMGGGGGGGDIQTSAVEEAQPTPKTLNSIIICVYRNSRRNFEQRRVWLVKKDHRHEQHLRTSHLRTDAAFFDEIRYRYRNQLRGTFRRYISFKTVSTARILEYGNNRFGLANVNEKLFSPVFMKAYNNPDGTLLDPRKHPNDPTITSSDWILWFWAKRRHLVDAKKVNLAIELVEDYDPTRVMGAIAIALFIYFTLTIVWLAKGGDPGYVAGVMSFVLSILAVMVGLTGLYDWLDLGHMGGGKDFLVLDHGDFEDAGRNGWGGPTTGEPYPRRSTRL